MEVGFRETIRDVLVLEACNGHRGNVSVGQSGRGRSDEKKEKTELTWVVRIVVESVIHERRAGEFSKVPVLQIGQQGRQMW
jgi:hypothetical protein